MPAGRICVRNVDIARSDDSAWVAAQRMHQRGVGTLVVVNDAQEPIGVITDRDLVERVMAKDLDPRETHVRQVMTTPAKCVCEDTPVNALVPLMHRGGFRRLPVTDTDGKLIGLITLDDILMMWANDFSFIGQLLNRETPRGVAEDLLAVGR